MIIAEIGLLKPNFHETPFYDPKLFINHIRVYVWKKQTRVCFRKVYPNFGNKTLSMSLSKLFPYRSVKTSLAFPY